MKVLEVLIDMLSTIALSLFCLFVYDKTQNTSVRMDKIQGIADTSLSNSIQALEIITNIQRKVDSALAANRNTKHKPTKQ